MRSAENLIPAREPVGSASTMTRRKSSADILRRLARTGIGVVVVLALIQAGPSHADGSAADRRNQSLADHLAVAAQSAREAQKALSSGQVDACAAAVRKAKQSCKEVVGILTDRPSYDDQLGKPINETLRALKDPRAVCAPADTADQGKTLAAVSDRLERLASASPGTAH